MPPPHIEALLRSDCAGSADRHDFRRRVGSATVFRRNISAGRPLVPIVVCAGRDKLRFHRASERVALQLASGDRLVREPQLSKGELVAEQPIGIRLVGIVRTYVVNRSRDDVGVVVGQPPRSPDGYEPGRLDEARFQSFRLHHFDMGDR